MKHIFATVKIKETEIDLKIPCNIYVEEVLGILSEALSLNIPTSSKMQAEPLGRILSNAETLAEQGVCNGAILTII